MKRPNPFLHMMTWGFFIGTILIFLFITFISFRSIDSGVDLSLAIFAVPFTFLYALLFGGAPGLGLGLVDGFILWLTMRGRPMPFSRENMKAARWPVYGWLGALTFCGYFSLIFLPWILYDYKPLLFFPPIIAALASVYAGHHYLLRLALWSEQAYGTRKEKAKNDALGRLEDKPKNESYLSTDEDLERKSRQ